MNGFLVALLAIPALSGANGLHADIQAPAERGPAQRVLIAQKTAVPAGPVSEPGSSMSKPHPFPSSSAAGVSEKSLSQDEAYSSAIQDCESLPGNQRKACVDDINKRFGQM